MKTPTTTRIDPEMTKDAPVSAQLWHEVNARLTAFVAQRIDNAADVEDLVQTVFLRVHQHAESVHDDDRVLPWLFQITRNAIADYYRAPGRRREVAIVSPQGLLLHDGSTSRADTRLPLGHVDTPPSGAFETMTDETAMTELAACVRPMIEQLADHYREALTLVELDAVSQVEAATRLGMSVSGMKSRVQRGRAMLRDLLLACCSVSQSATGGVLDFQPHATTDCASVGCGCRTVLPEANPAGGRNCS